ncbi:MAG: DUF1566 domain-containing protein [Trichlorobacter sp.]|nr:DUF1566 domain-containing protein [Trichlorobacter sp.]
MKQFVKLNILLAVMLISALLGGCSGSNTTSNSTATGAAVAKLVWQETPAATAVKAAAPLGVATVRVTITADDITPDIQQEFAASANSGTINNIPVGDNRTFTFQGLDSGGNITHLGEKDNVNIIANATANLGTITMLVAIAPAAPANLTATAHSTSQIDLAWADSDQLETGFTIERKTGSGEWDEIATDVAANTTSYSDTGLTAATAYTYRIKATNTKGASAWSVEATATTSPQAAAVKLPKTGQTTSYAAGDDGATQRGVAWPNPRFTDNNNGTVTDNLTGLIWLKNANCDGSKTWADALAWSNGLADGACGLTDGSQAGDWQLPNIVELESLVDLEKYNPALPADPPFTGVQSDGYWSSSAYANGTGSAWFVYVALAS